MKTMKYRVVVGVFMSIALSVFLFTSCEKESDGVPGKVDRLSKFKSLTFTGQTTSTTSNSGSGTFTGNGNNISYTPPEQEPPVFSPSVQPGAPFTDPTTSGNSFSVVDGFALGGGTVTLDGKSFPINFGFCANTDLFGDAPSPGTGNSNPDDLNVFIGVSGDFDISAFDEDETIENPLDLILYVFSYNGASTLGGFDDFENGIVNNSAFVMAIVFNEDEDIDPDLYFSTAGSVNFAGDNVTLSGVSMSKVIEDMQLQNILDNETVGLQAFLECGGITFEDNDSNDQ